MARRDESRAARMARVMAELEASGLSVARFARQRGLAAPTLYQWRRELREAAKRREPVGFVEVKVAGESLSVATMAVELPSGVRVHVPRGFVEEDLRRLVGALSSC